MIKVVSVAEMVAIEAATDEAGVTYAQMMERAGRAVADVVADHFAGHFDDRSVLILVGPGNNGGDGLVAARLLALETSLAVSCYLLKPRSEDDANFVSAREAGVFFAAAPDDRNLRVLRNLANTADVIVDALLGTGARLPAEGMLNKLLVRVKHILDERRAKSHPHLVSTLPSAGAEQANVPAVIAVDCPSGLDCDSGALDVAALAADVTVTFAAAKHGHLRLPGGALLGRLVVADIDVPAKLKEWKTVNVNLADAEGIRDLLPERPAGGHKGTFGRAMLAAGSLNYTGAVRLAGEAAYRVGAGLVTLALPQPIYPVVAASLPEATYLLLPHDMGVLNSAAAGVLWTELGAASALLLGPGWGTEPVTDDFLMAVLQPDSSPQKGGLGFLPGEEKHGDKSQVSLPPLVVDADALNLLAAREKWWTLLPSDTVLTPHPGEMARLTGLTTAGVQSDRLAVAREYAHKWGCVVVFKGAYTIVAVPDGSVTVMPFANSGLAKGGTGDVLAGAIVGLLAQGLSAADAAIAGAYLHGLAGQLAVQVGQSARSLLAGEVAVALSRALAMVE